jgi:hypothetical protein
MPNITLPDGREITIDLSAITVREYRELFNTKQTAEEEDATMSKVSGLSVDELLDLPQPEYRRMWQVFFQGAREPLSDPNSVSESTLES